VRARPRGQAALVDLVVLVDSLVHAEVTTPEQLRAAADRWHGHGARLARRAMRLVRSGAESPMETRLRLLVVLAGLPEPVVQLRLVGEGADASIRLDLAYPAWRVAVEYDGRQHADSPAQWRRDIVRREVLDRLGWRLVVVLADGLHVDPATTLERVVQALRDQGARGVRVRGTAWRRHFPGRDAGAG
jgi:hypothetical protein